MEESLLGNLPGMRDLLPEEIGCWQLVEDRARIIFSRYGFSEIRTPILEATELFARGIGGDTDIVGKEMYTFEDQSGKSITLRPEATASVVRAYIQHTMYRGSGISKLCYGGPMFRHEKKQKGRWRQFYQIGAEVLGSDHPAIESEAIEMVLALLESLQISTKLLINSVGCPACRPLYIRVLRAKLEEIRAQLCEDCRRRTETNPLRVLDCKVEDCQPHIAMLPMISDHLCSGCSDHFARFRGFLDDAGISYQALPRLVRGLDYYVRTAFEIVSGDLGAQNALVGGGRYDGLSEVLGGPPIHGFGFAMGLDRLVMLLPKAIADQATSHADLFIVYRGESAFRNALSVASRLRREGHFCQLDFSSGSFKSQFRLANKVNARHVLIIGEEELATGRYAIKRLEDSHQWNVSLAELLDYLTSLQIPQSI